MADLEKIFGVHASSMRRDWCANSNFGVHAVGMRRDRCASVTDEDVGVHLFLISQNSACAFPFSFNLNVPLL